MSSDPAAAEAERSEALLLALADDLDAGFEELVRTHQRILYTVALRVSGVPAEAEDLAAESFLRAYRALRGYDRSRTLALRPRPWLLTILLNTWRNTVRSATRRPPQTPVPSLPDRASEDPSVEKQVEDGETRRELADLVARLPEDQRVAVVLRHVVGLPTSEIASVMRIPEGTAKSHTSRGLRALRELYETNGAAGPAAPVPASGGDRR